MRAHNANLLCIAREIDLAIQLAETDRETERNRKTQRVAEIERNAEREKEGEYYRDKKKIVI